MIRYRRRYSGPGGERKDVYISRINSIWFKVVGEWNEDLLWRVRLQQGKWKTREKLKLIEVFVDGPFLSSFKVHKRRKCKVLANCFNFKTLQKKEIAYVATKVLQQHPAEHINKHLVPPFSLTVTLYTH